MTTDLPTINSADGNEPAAMDTTQLLEAFQNEGAIQLGQFKLKSGQISPIYVDLRVLISTPQIMKDASHALSQAINGTPQLAFDYIVGVPFGAIMLATLVSTSLDKPMLLKRKEAKTYGKRLLIEGKFEQGKRALIIEDVVTSGASIMETVEALRAVGLQCEHVFCVLDREQGGPEALRQKGIILHSLIKMSSILDFLQKKGTIDAAKKAEITHRLANPIYEADGPPEKESEEKAHTNGHANVPDEPLEKRVRVPKCGLRCEADAEFLPETADLVKRRARLMGAKFPEGSVNKRLAEIMATKKTNVCLAVDCTRAEDVLKIVEEAKEQVCAVKLHHDIIKDFDAQFVAKLTQMANDYRFLIVEDRKYADTGATMELQLTSGPLPVAEWADLVTVHALVGQSSIASLKPIIDSPAYRLSGILLIAQLSTEGALIGADYTRQSVSIARECPAGMVAGFICQQCCDTTTPSDSDSGPGFLCWTPGVNLNATSDVKGQQWRTVDEAIGRDGCDVIIVGRGITGAAGEDKIRAQARLYAQAGWEALTARKTEK